MNRRIFLHRSSQAALAAGILPHLAGCGKPAATGDDAPTRETSVADLSCMNAPVAFWLATVPRTQASLTVVCAVAVRVNRLAMARARDEISSSHIGRQCSH